jgi:3-methylcrotonyl-CoA carboxylase alpha subunit
MVHGGKFIYCSIVNPMFKKILIANRGEIACRIIKSAHKLGIHVVAVFSEIDADALHVKWADEAYPLVGDSSLKTYLNAEQIIHITKQAAVEAIHPGYGFLSENADFAELCQQQGLIFIGPSPQAIRAMGDKVLAKTIMEKAGVPVVPGFHGNCQDRTKIQEMAEKIGYPVLIKASAGGGGKGMRLVENAAMLIDAVEAARREAQSSFGNNKIFLEKYLIGARHIEAQILFDQSGHGLYLFNRDCSIQRRHQKIIEEAPAIGLSADTLKKMETTALTAAKAIQYVNAGTIEFLIDKQENVYFMEMNTRLQVEHPVTEMITGIDIVAWQIRIAFGEQLNLHQPDLKIQGHAIEARLYAENPEQDFIPSAGVLNCFRFPEEKSDEFRIDTGFCEGDKVSIFYDPLLAKIIVWGKNRSVAITKLQHYLKKIMIIGPSTNLSLLYRIAKNPDFIDGFVSTQFLEEHASTLLQGVQKISPEVILLTSLALQYCQEKEQKCFRIQSEDSFSPWSLKDGWRLNTNASQILFFFKEDQTWKVEINTINDVIHVKWQDHHYQTSFCEIQELKSFISLTIQLDSQMISAFIFNQRDEIIIFYEGEYFTFSTTPPKSQQILSNSKELLAPMPGTIIETAVSPEQAVFSGDKLFVIEAMKMEHVLTATCAGVIQSVFFQTGDRINAGALLLTFK